MFVLLYPRFLLVYLMFVLAYSVFTGTCNVFISSLYVFIQLFLFLLENGNRFIDFEQCICPVGFGGPHCEIKIDSCKDLPCYVNVTCTNTPVNGSIIAKCAPCPAGLTGDGRKCYGKIVIFF